jgi:hypothetical protein
VVESAKKHVMHRARAAIRKIGVAHDGEARVEQALGVEGDARCNLNRD